MDSLFKKLVHRKALIVRNADLEKIVKTQDSISASLSRQIDSFILQTDLLTKDLALSKNSNMQYEKIIGIDKELIKGLTKRAKGRWWLGLGQGAILGAAIFLTLSLTKTI